MLRFSANAMALALAALALGAPLAEAKPFRFAVSGDANTMDPHSQNAGQVTLILRQIYEPLILRGKKLEKIPGLATSWQSRDGQPGNGSWNYGRYSLAEMDRLVDV